MTTKAFVTSFAEEHKGILSSLQARAKEVIASSLSSLSTESKDSVPAAIESLQQRIVKLNSEYTQHASALPTYEQRRCQEQLKELSRTIEEQKAKYIPKQRFSFKSRLKANSTTPPPVVAAPPPPPPALPVIADSAIETVADNGITLSTSNTYLSTSADLHSSNVRLLSMIKSVINLIYPRRHATLHARDLSNCIIMASEFDGAAHLTNLFNCIVILKCHQFRMHESRGVKDIEFAGYPSVIAEKVRLSGVEEEEWMAKEMVDDFNWLRKEHSPNWRIQRDTIKGEVWGKVLDTMEGGSASVDTIRQILEE